MSITLDIDGTEYPYPSGASDTNWAADQVAVTQALLEYIDDTATSLAELETSVTTITWSNLTLLNSWANVGGGAINAASALLPDGVVMVRGEIDSGSASTVAFTLASGRRPPGTIRVLAVCSADDDACWVSIAANGNVTIGPVITGGGGDPTDGVHLNFSFSIAANP